MLNSCREESERVIDWLYDPLKGKIKKPRTYRRNARKQYLNIVKKKKPSKKAIRIAIRQQLQYVKRNIAHIRNLLTEHYQNHFPFTEKSRWRDLKLFWVMQHIYEQQQYMYANKTHRCAHRIVSLYQPYVRPIVRGKKKVKVEFGAKINVSEVDGMAKVEQLHWEAFNESIYLETCVETYKTRYGYYPEVVLVDSLYLNRKNRDYLKQKGIRHVGKPLGRPPKEQLTAYQKRKRRKLLAERNHIEAKFGTAKNGYNLNKIRATRQDTSESWIMAIFFILSLDKYVQWAEIAEKNEHFIFF